MFSILFIFSMAVYRCEFKFHIHTCVSELKTKNDLFMDINHDLRYYNYTKVFGLSLHNNIK